MGLSSRQRDGGLSSGGGHAGRPARSPGLEGADLSDRWSDALLIWKAVEGIWGRVEKEG